jgi:hypothetical protein
MRLANCLQVDSYSGALYLWQAPMLSTVVLKGTRSKLGAPVSWSLIPAWTNGTDLHDFILDSTQEAASSGSTNPLVCHVPTSLAVCYDAETAAVVWKQLLDLGAPYAILEFIDQFYDPYCQ